MLRGMDKQIEDAARQHREAWKSDPFAYGRIKLHMRRGMELPSDVGLDATRILNTRRGLLRHDAIGE